MYVYKQCFFAVLPLLHYSQVRGDSAALDRGETINFDTYQNTIGLALSRVLTKFNWVTLRTTADERVTEVGRGAGRGGESRREAATKNIQSLISLLSWQLATLWDTVQRVRRVIHEHYLLILVHIHGKLRIRVCVQHTNSTRSIPAMAYKQDMYVYTCTLYYTYRGVYIHGNTCV